MEAIRPALEGRRFDVAVIGGGISGVAIAKACAQGGLKALLLERHDFGAGTSSRSTRIIHGGLRYLEHGEIALVRESLRERERMRVEKPHLVRPLKFLLAFPQQHALSLRNPVAVRFGLWLYKRMAGAGASLAKPKLEMEGWRVFDYDDAQCEFPERLIAEWVTEAAAAGAAARNHSEVLEVLRRDGRVRGVRVRDRLTGVEYEVEATNVVNASGPWADQVCAASGIGRGQMLGGVRGSHIVLPEFHGMPDAAVYTEAEDGRPFFVVPWNGQVLVGTTEVADDGDPAEAAPSGEEITYLWRAFSRVFPAAGLRRDEIRWAFAGVRPLPRSEQNELGAISRRYFIHDHSDDGAVGMWSVIGGKLTTAAALGRECARKLGAKVPEPATALVASGPANGYDATLAHWAKQVSDATRNCNGVVTMASARAVAEWQGRAALGIVRNSCRDDRWTERLCEHSPHIVGEAVHAIENEMAVTLGDILLRRVPVALGACWSRECSRQAAERIGRALGWSGARAGMEWEVFEQERRAFLRDPQTLTSYGAAPLAKNVA